MIAQGTPELAFITDQSVINAIAFRPMYQVAGNTRKELTLGIVVVPQVMLALGGHVQWSKLGVYCFDIDTYTDEHRGDMKYCTISCG